MTWELVPETRQTQRKFPSWIVHAVGVVVILVGIGLLLWPFTAASWILAALFGAALAANGLALLVGTKPSGGSAVAGLMLIAAGVLAVVFVEFTVAALVAFVAVGLIAVGALWVALGSRFAANRPLLILPGVIALAGGIAALIWPSAALTLAALAAGIITILLGVFIVWGATRLRRVMVTRISGASHGL